MAPYTWVTWLFLQAVLGWRPTLVTKSSSRLAPKSHS